MRRLYVARQPNQLYAVVDLDAGQMAYLNLPAADVYAVFRCYRESEIEAEVVLRLCDTESSNTGDPAEWGKPGYRWRTALTKLATTDIGWLRPVLAGGERWTGPGYAGLPPTARRDTLRAWWGRQVQTHGGRVSRRRFRGGPTDSTRPCPQTGLGRRHPVSGQRAGSGADGGEARAAQRAPGGQPGDGVGRAPPHARGRRHGRQQTARQSAADRGHPQPVMSVWGGILTGETTDDEDGQLARREEHPGPEGLEDPRPRAPTNHSGAPPRES